MQCSVGDARQRLAPGDIFGFGGLAPAKVRAVPEVEASFFWFSALAEHLFPLFTSDELHLLRSVMAFYEGGRYYPATRRLARKCHKLIRNVPPEFNLPHRVHLLHVVGTILSPELRNRRLAPAAARTEAEAATQALEKLSVSEILDSRVSELAEKLDYSLRHLNRLFHQHFGISLTGLRMELRLLKAACLLRDPAVQVNVVAEQCGFKQLTLFHSCFRRRFGSSPGHWRQTVAPTCPPRANPRAPFVLCGLLALGLCARASSNGADGNGKSRALDHSPSDFSPSVPSGDRLPLNSLALPEAQFLGASLSDSTSTAQAPQTLNAEGLCQ